MAINTATTTKAVAALGNLAAFDFFPRRGIGEFYQDRLALVIMSATCWANKVFPSARLSPFGIKLEGA
jgi:hypothetical protein